MRRLIALVFATVILVAIVGCTRSNNYEGDLDIYVISYPTYFFTQELVGYDINIQMLDDASTTIDNLVVTDEMKKLAKDGDLIIYHTSDDEIAVVEEIFEVSMAEATEEDPSYLQVFDASLDVNEIATPAVLADSVVPSLYKEYDDNPYYWLDPIRMQVMVTNIKDFLIEEYPELKDQIEENYLEIEGKLFQIDAQMREIAENGRINTIVVDAPYFDHWSKYGIYELSLRTNGSFVYKPDTEINSIKSFAQSEVIKYIVATTDSDMEKIQSIATELDATIVTLHNIEKLTEEDVANGETYYTLMKKNMNTLVEMVK